MLPERDSQSGQGGDPEDKKNWVKGLALFTAILADLIGTTGAGIFIGYMLWKKAGFPWWVILFFSSAGLVLAFYRLYQVSKKDWNG